MSNIIKTSEVVIINSFNIIIFKLFDLINLAADEDMNNIIQKIQKIQHIKLKNNKKEYSDNREDITTVNNTLTENEKIYKK